MKRILWISTGLVAGVLVGQWAGSDRGAVAPAIAEASNGAMQVTDGATFVSTDGGDAYLWRRTGDTIQLVGQCRRTGDELEQATFVWMPGVERGS